MNYKVVILIVVVCAVALLYYNSAKNRGLGQYDDFAKCLTEKGVSIAGTDWCKYCKEQKKTFGPSFQYVDYHNCDSEREWCASNGIRGYPTWVLPDGRTYSGAKSLQTLSTLSGCDL